MTLTGDAGAVAPGQVARAGPWWWSRRRGLVLDAVLALVSALECMVVCSSFAHEHGVWPAVGAALGLLAGGTLLLRRRWPVAVVLVALAISPVRIGLLLGLVSLYTLAASKLPRRGIAGLVAAMSVATALGSYVALRAPLTRAGLTSPGWLPPLIDVLITVGVTAPPVLLGLYVGARRRLVESLRERADGLERELSLLADKAGERAERARIEERTRIARDMHDVVAHRVSLMVVHASAVRAVLRTDPSRAEASADLLGDMGRQALGELREMLGVLRVPSPTAAPAPCGGAPDTATAATAAPAGPAPAALPPASQASGDGSDNEAGGGAEEDESGEACLARLDLLIEQSRAAGMSVTLAEEGDPRPLTARVEQTAYRVVQEALTNAHKHAVGAATLVRVAYRPDEIAVLIENGPPTGASPPDLPSGGNGLLGMRERVTALGGGCVAGPSRAGGFRVSAVIPA